MNLIKSQKTWKTGFGKGRKKPRGRIASDQKIIEVQKLIKDFPTKRDKLIEYLHLIQDKFNCIDHEHIVALSELMMLSQTEIYEVATFYAHFDVIKEGEVKPPSITIRVCDSLSCELNGAQKLLKELKENTNSRDIRILRAPCMGRCDTAPTVEIGHNHVDYANISKINKTINNKDFKPKIPNYQSLKNYLSNGGYEKYKECLEKKITRDEIENKVLNSGLRGLGGAGFPSGKKWSFVRKENGRKFLAVNGDEGEPGTFKDRYYLEKEPHFFLEGMLIAAWAVEAEHIYIYMRDEYPAILKILDTEIRDLESKKIINKGFVEVRRGAGAYICGEESAMIESIEGKRGLPRHRPPFVAQKGIFGSPTLVHNIETLYWVAKICRFGEEVFNSFEKNGRKGLRSYSVSGRVKKPGVYLLPSGSTILDIIKASGGMKKGHIFKAYQPGGPSSGLLPATLNDIPLDFDTLQKYNTFIGSAAVIVLSDKDSAKKAALNMLKFFEDESCGQCTPCRVGCEKAVKLMSQKNWNKDLLKDLSETMIDASICGLGQAAPNAFLSTMRFFDDEI